MHLGGWFRFGIVISVLYGVLVACIAYRERPMLEHLQNVWLGDAADVISESISQEEGRAIPSSEVSEHFLKDGGTKSVTWLEKIASSPSEPQKLFSEAVARVNKKHEAIIAALPAQQREYWLIAFAYWAGGTLLLFGSGWTTRWVYRGFRPI